MLCAQQRGDNWTCNSHTWTTVGVQRKAPACASQMFASLSPWVSLKQGLGTELLAWWVCIVAAARNPYQGNICFVQGAKVPHHSEGYMVNKTQSGFVGALCQSKTKSLSKELLHLTLQLSVLRSEFDSPYHNNSTLVQWGLPGTNPNLKKKENKITPAIITTLPYAVLIVPTKITAHLLTWSLRAVLNISDVAVLLKLYLTICLVKTLQHMPQTEAPDSV